jgi:hypothetical protein
LRIKSVTLGAMNKQWPIVLLLVLALVVIMAAWVRQETRISMGEEASLQLQPTAVPTVLADQGPRRSLVLVDFFAGY